MNHLYITSSQNPRIKSTARLHKRRQRDTVKLYLIEGPRPLRRAITSDIRLLELYYCPDFFNGDEEAALVQEISDAGTPCFRVHKDIFIKLAYREHPEGLLAVAKQHTATLSDLKLSANPFVIVVEKIEKPGNLGTILRSADATGAEAVIVCDSITDIFNPNVVRASTGTLFHVPVVVTDSQQALAFLRSHHINTVAATPAATTIYTHADFTQSIALIMGSEDQGLTDTWLTQCDLPVRLPMQGIADSLNVSAATVVLAYEVVRQRSN